MVSFAGEKFRKGKDKGEGVEEWGGVSEQSARLFGFGEGVHCFSVLEREFGGWSGGSNPRCRS